MTKPEKDATTRACATQLLGSLRGEEVDKILAQLKDDPERRVRFQALCGLAVRDAQARKTLQDFWQQPDTTAFERWKILQVLAFGPAADSVAIFQSAVKDTALDEAGRVLAAQMLGRVGDSSCLAALTECAEKDPSEKVRAVAKDAIAAVNSRGKSGASSLTLPVS